MRSWVRCGFEMKMGGSGDCGVVEVGVVVGLVGEVWWWAMGKTRGTR